MLTVLTDNIKSKEKNLHSHGWILLCFVCGTIWQRIKMPSDDSGDVNVHFHLRLSTAGLLFSSLALYYMKRHVGRAELNLQSAARCLSPSSWLCDVILQTPVCSAPIALYCPYSFHIVIRNNSFARPSSIVVSNSSSKCCDNKIKKKKKETRSQVRQGAL